MNRLERYWYDNPRPSLFGLGYVLLFLSWIFGRGVNFRRWCFQKKIFSSKDNALPVIVIGNITVGGTGKTPLLLALIHLLEQQGHRPGVVSRGYGGKARGTTWVSYDSAPNEVGDEPAMLVRRKDLPFVVDKNRSRAVEAIFSETSCNIVLSDDGLQHYRLARDLEIAVVDQSREHGNGKMLPLGPLREPVSRLQECGIIAINGDRKKGFHIEPHHFYPLGKPQKQMPLSEFKGKMVHAVVGVGHPARFFKTLTGLGVIVMKHVFSDHHRYQEKELNFDDDYPVVMTEKDAVKCESFASKNVWVLSVNAVLSSAFQTKFLEKVREIV
jgi:tetraacyldisaccharide 4'-kinase